MQFSCLQVDLRIHSTLRYTCLDSSKVFTQQAGLSIHRRNAHVKEKNQPQPARLGTTDSSDEQTMVTSPTSRSTSLQIPESVLEFSPV